MNKQNLKNNFYSEVNKEWLEKTVIPSDKASIGAFTEIDEQMEELLKTLSKEWATGKRELPADSKMQEYVKFYKMTSDWDKRNELGIKPVLKYIKEIEELKSFEDLNAKYLDFSKKFISLPFEAICNLDFNDSEKNVLWFGITSNILPNKDTYYDKKQKDLMLNKYKEVAQTLLEKIGKTTQEAQDLINKALVFDESLVESSYSSVEKANYRVFYNVKNIEEMESISNFFEVKNILESWVNTKVESVVVENLRDFAAFNDIFNEKTFENYKAFLLITNLISMAKYLDDETRQIASSFQNFLYGIKESPKKERYAYLQAFSFFKMPVGLYYAHNYFGEKAKNDVEEMITEMIKIYKERLLENDFLSKETIQKAILKLNTFRPMVGYPSEIRPFYSEMKVKEYKENGNVLDNALEFVHLKNKFTYSLYLKPTNNNYWEMTPAMVNAYYNPLKNVIVFPAGILQSPFYDINNSSSTNFGGIGAVIAHEISHGFDNNGANFDEKGNMTNWWTDEDKAKFEQKTQDVINLFDKRNIGVGLCNGKLTVSENIADMGGFACALEAAKRRSDFNIKDFFVSWARIWRRLSTEETQKRLLETDVHAPAILRANVQLMNCPEFQDEYEITEGDGMYLPKNKMVKIW